MRFYWSKRLILSDKNSEEFFFEHAALFKLIGKSHLLHRVSVPYLPFSLTVCIMNIGAGHGTDSSPLLLGKSDVWGSYSRWTSCGSWSLLLGRFGFPLTGPGSKSWSVAGGFGKNPGARPLNIQVLKFDARAKPCGCRVQTRWKSKFCNKCSIGRNTCPQTRWKSKFCK